MENLKSKVIQKSKELGIDKIGFASAEPFLELEEPLKKQRAEGRNSGFEPKDIESRVYLEKLFPNPKSIIAIALAYPTKIHEEIPQDEKRGLFSRASWGVDYHFILEEKLQQLIAYIQEEGKKCGENWRLDLQVDTGNLVDVTAAQRAGLGFVGRNGLLITEEFGSFVYLGEIVTNIAFEPDLPGEFGCGSCTRCMTACPTKAILPEGLDAKRCLSYQTQTKDFMPKEYRKKIRNVIYGCDICQLVCPYNQGKDFHFHPAMEPKVDEVAPKLKPLLHLSNREFKEQFGHLAGSWRGKKPLQRNAIIALANLNDRSSLPDLYEQLKDLRPVIRGTAAWAIGQLGRKEAKEAVNILQTYRKEEKEAEVNEEITEAIEKLQKYIK